MNTPEHDAKFEQEEEELKRIRESMDRYQDFDDDEVDDDEYARLWQRFVELRRAGHGPQPFDIE